MLQYCGYPVTQYALRKYGESLIADKLNHVQYCEHGDRCESCCFLYTGRISLNKNTYHTNKPARIAAISLTGKHTSKSPRAFFQRLVFGYHPTAKVFPSCQTPVCCNIWHNRLRWKAFVAEDIFHHIDVCKHGRLCKRCCWKWNGKQTKGV